MSLSRRKLDYTLFSELGGFSRGEIDDCISLMRSEFGDNIKNILLENPEYMITFYRKHIDPDLVFYLRMIYQKGYEFPKWVQDSVLNGEMWFEDFLSLSQIFYLEGEDVSEIRKLAIQREPCNIEQGRYYDLEVMKNVFGWDVGYYQSKYDKTKELAPNIAIYCKTPVKAEKRGDFIDYPDAHILNSIGLAFDDPRQPDYQYFFGPGKERENSYRLITEFYDIFFDFLYSITRKLGFKVLVMSAVGANNFAKAFPLPGNSNPYTMDGREYFQENIFAPLFLKHILKNPDVTTLTMGMYNFSGEPNKIMEYLINKETKLIDIGYFPNLLINEKLKENGFTPEEMLLVNAWDPLSIVGNGNENDPSLDGYVGRNTACSVLCWPHYNRRCKYIPIKTEQ